MSKESMFVAFDAFTLANFLYCEERKVRVSHSYQMSPAPIEGREANVTYFVTSEIYPDTDERRMTIRAMVIDGLTKRFTTFGPEGAFKSRKTVDRAFSMFKNPDMTHVIKADGTMDVIPKGTIRAPAQASASEVPAAKGKEEMKEIKKTYSAAYGTPGYMPNYEKPTRYRLDFKDWPDEEKVHHACHIAPYFHGKAINAQRVKDKLPPIKEIWACYPDASAEAKYAKWKAEGGEHALALAVASAKDDSEAAQAVHPLKEEWSAATPEGRERVAKSIANIGELFEDSGEAFMYLQDSGMQDMPQMEFEKLVAKARKH